MLGAVTVPTKPPSGFPTLAAILLAAGSSRRYGADNKLLAQVDGSPLILRVATALAAARFKDIIVVTGHDAAPVAQALHPVSAALRFVHNPQHHDGMGRSIAVGIAALPPGIAGVLIAQADMPDVDASLITTLCQRFLTTGRDRITAPWIADAAGGGRHGNPVIWPARLFPDLAALSGDQGGKALIKAAGDAIERVTVNDTSAATDIDTPEQLAAYTRERMF
jgi:molybdenum cofactor cytidylyltransferase